MQETIGPLPEEIGFTPDVSQNNGKQEKLAEVIQFPKRVEAAKNEEVINKAEAVLLEQLEGIEDDPNAQSWFKKVGKLSKDTKTYLAGELGLSASSAFWAGGSTLKSVEAFSQNRKFEGAVFAAFSAIMAALTLGSGVRARRYGTLPTKEAEKLTWGDNRAQ